MGARFRETLQLRWQRANSSLWFIPAIEVVAAIVLALVLLHVDAVVGGTRGGGSGWLFNGTADGARTILSTIAGSVVTVVAVIFSVTMIAIQQASTQYTPRVLRNFTRDRGNQWVLGTYIATFVFSLLVLRRIRSEFGDFPAFIPTISIFASILLALICLGLLIYFIHHASQLMQISQLLGRIREELNDEIRRLFPSEFGRESRDPRPLEEILASHAADCRGQPLEIRARHEGYLRRIDEHALLRRLAGKARVVAVEVMIGEYVLEDDLITRVWAVQPEADGEQLAEEIEATFVFDRERSITEDPRFGFRQLVDVALKAISPGVNDPTTAEQALDQISGAIGMLAQREFPSTERQFENGGVLVVRAPSFADYVDLGFSQIRRFARGQPQVILYLLGRLNAVARKITDPGRMAAIRGAIGDLFETLAWDVMNSREREQIRKRAELVIAAMREVNPELGFEPVGQPQ